MWRDLFAPRATTRSCRAFTPSPQSTGPTENGESTDNESLEDPKACQVPLCCCNCHVPHCYCFYPLATGRGRRAKPRPKLSLPFPTICSKPVRSNQQGVECSKCALWTHRRCCGMSVDNYNLLGGVDWFCQKCLSAELPFASSSDVSLNGSFLSGANSTSLQRSPLPIASNTSMYTPLSHFSTYHVNIRSIYNSLCDLQEFTAKLKPDILALSETWLDSSVLDSELALAEYSLYRKDRNRHGGGIAMYLKSSLSSYPITKLNTSQSKSSLESLWIAISSPTLPSQVAVCVCYRPPSSTTNAIDDLCTEIEQVMTHYRRIIVCGDININLLSQSHLSRKFHCFTQMHGLEQVIVTPTRITPTTSSLLDVIVVDDGTAVVNAGTMDVALSDH